MDTGLTSNYGYVLAIDPSTPATVYAGTDGGAVFKSTNGGGNWTAMDTGLTSNYGYVLAIDPSTPATVYAGTNGGVFKSTNGGENWTAMNTGLTNSNVSALTIDPNTPATVYAGTNGGGVFKSTNGGENWTAMNTGLTNQGVFALALDPSTSATVYAGTNSGVFKSANGGENWTAMNSGLTNQDVSALAVDPMNPSILYAGTEGGGVFKSEQEICPIPGVVSNPSPSNQAANVSTNPTLNWSGSSDADSYDVYFGTSSDPTNLVDSPTNTSFPLSGLDLNTTYYWKIVARNDCGQSTSGPVWSFSTVQPTIYALTVIKSGTGSGMVTSSPAGINCGSNCSGSYEQGTSVTLTASADGGSTFTGWSGGGCSGTDPCTISLNSDTTITASFVLLGNCAYTISPTNKTFNAKGGSVSIKVSATGETNCPVPPVVEDAEWISVSGTPTWKANKGTVKIAVQKNPGSQSRTGVVSIGGQNLTIQEDGAICQLTALKPSSGKYSNTGGGGSFDITVSPQDCGWNVATPFDWVHLDTTTGTGSGTAVFHIDANGTGKNRTGKIDVSLAQNATKKKTFTVNESK
jgi:hypothetical protein